VCIEKRLRSNAQLIREQYLNKPFPKNNVAIIEVHLADQIFLSVGATSKAKSPVPKPKPKSAGGQFEPIVDSHSGYLMAADAEYKALSALAETLEMFDNPQIKGKLYLYSERNPCESCQGVITQFKQKFPNLEITLFWDYPYPPLS